MKDWLLSDVQKEAVQTTEGPLLIFAGAGSGKTRVITYRIVYLMKAKKIAPENILAVTFTNKAAKEMKERVSSLVDDPALIKKLTISTFHALGLQILKKEHKQINYPANFVLYTPYEQTELLKKVMEEKNISRERFSARGLLSIISNLKNNPELLDNKNYFFNIKNSVAKELFPIYNQALRLAGAMDFDDLIIKVIELFKKHDDIRKKYAIRYQYVMVDEYQDTNSAQYLIVKYLTSEYKNLCVVGDDDQSIYSWRGAKVENILNFHNDFKGCKIVKLEQNYRSIDEIVNAASRLIHYNKTRAAKTVFTENKASSEDGIEVIYKSDEIQEAEFITSKIEELVSSGNKIYGDMAIIVRANHQTRPFEIAFSRRRVPFTIIGGQKFFENKEIKDLIAYLRILINPNDEISLRRIINYPTRGIGLTTQDKLFDFATLQKKSAAEIVMNIEEYEEHFKKSQIKSLGKFKELYHNLQTLMLNSDDPVEFARKLVRSVEIQPQILKTAENDTVAKIKFENINEFINAVSYYGAGNEFSTPLSFYTDFINSISLIQSADEKETKSNVNIITAHSAKGLEFDTVFLIGFYMGGFPNRIAIEEGNIEEERRLCYVAITRAKRKLIITIPSTVRNYGRLETATKSIFLREAGLEDERYYESTEFDNVADMLGKIRVKIRD